MSKEKKILRNIIVLFALMALILKMLGLYLTPLSAHESSERSIHYGPSEVVHIQDFAKGKYILCKYDKWVSCNTVNRKLFFFWKFGNQPIGFENDETKAIDFIWGMSEENYKLYGKINDNQIKKIQITLKNGKDFVETEFHDNLFLFIWEPDDVDDDFDLNSMIGYDTNDNIVFEYEYGY